MWDRVRVLPAALLGGLAAGLFILAVSFFVAFVLFAASGWAPEAEGSRELDSQHCGCPAAKERCRRALPTECSTCCPKLPCESPSCCEGR